MSKKEYKKIQKELSIILSEKNISKKNLANKIGISEKTLRRMENISDKTYIPTEITLNKIENFLKNKSKNEIDQTDEILKKVNISIQKTLENIFSVRSPENLTFSQVNALKNDYESVNRAIKLIATLNLEITKYHTELDLILSSNELQTNRKLQKGIKALSANLINMGRKIESHLGSYIEIEDYQEEL